VLKNTNLAMNEILTYHIDADGIAVVTLDMHNYPTNVLNPAMADVLISTVKQLIDNQQVKGVVLTSAKRDFIAGADLHFLESLRSAQEAFSQTMSLHQALLDIERGGKPLVAAIKWKCARWGGTK
jgi:3-hydroxyacyl-CoA dehydrogenase/enoyl-CoA hydratase/3-hydroxybutyryl-CoA epimerase